VSGEFSAFCNRQSAFGNSYVDSASTLIVVTEAEAVIGLLKLIADSRKPIAEKYTPRHILKQNGATPLKRGIMFIKAERTPPFRGPPSLKLRRGLRGGFFHRKMPGLASS